MNSVQFVTAVADWLLADPAHLVVAASIVAALTPTPDPASLPGKLYRIVDLLALNILKAKQTGVPPVAPLPAPPVPSAADPAAKARQAGFARLGPALVIAATAAALLSGCAGLQSAAVSANNQAVQATLTAGKDELALGKELLCAAPFQSVVDAMAADAAFAAALPALCPAMKSVPAVPQPVVLAN